MKEDKKNGDFQQILSDTLKQKNAKAKAILSAAFSNNVNKKKFISFFTRNQKVTFLQKKKKTKSAPINVSRRRQVCNPHFIPLK